MTGSNEKEDPEKIIEQLKSALRRILDERAYTRMMNISLINKELFATGSQKLLMLYQRTGHSLTEKEVLLVLNTLRKPPKSGGISIRRN